MTNEIKKRAYNRFKFIQIKIKARLISYILNHMIISLITIEL